MRPFNRSNGICLCYHLSPVDLKCFLRSLYFQHFWLSPIFDLLWLCLELVRHILQKQTLEGDIEEKVSNHRQYAPPNGCS